MNTETVKINKTDGWTLIDVSEDKFITASKSFEVCTSSSQPSELVVGHFVKTMSRYKHVNVDGENLYVRGDAWVSFTTGVYASIIDLINTVSARWYWTFNGTSYGTIPVAELYSDFSLEATISTTSVNRTVVFDGGEEDGIFLKFRMEETTGYMSFFVGNGSVWELFLYGATTPVNDGAVHVVKATKSGSTYSIFIDGILEISAITPDAVIPKVKHIGVLEGVSRFWEGTISDLRVTGITNTDVYPSGTFNYKLDEPYSDSHIAVDSDNEDGEELWVIDVIFDGTEDIYKGIPPGGSLNPQSSYKVTWVNNTNGSARLRMNEVIAGTLLAGESFTSVVGNIGETNRFYVQALEDVLVGEVTGSVKQTTAMQKFNDLPEDYTPRTIANIVDETV